MTLIKKNTSLKMSYSSQEQKICNNKLKQGFNIDYELVGSPCELYHKIYNRHFLNSKYFLKLRRWHYEQELRSYVDNPLNVLNEEDWPNEQQRVNYRKKHFLFVDLLNYISNNRLSGVDRLSNNDIDFLDEIYTDYIDLRDNVMREGFASDFDADYLILNLAKLYLDVKYR